MTAPSPASNWARRGVIGTAAALATSLFIPARAAIRRNEWPLGVQLWSVTDELGRDLDGTLRRLSEIGVGEIELAGLHDHSPAAFAAAAHAADLRPISAHYAMADLVADPGRCIGESRDVGARWLVVAAPKPEHPLAPGVDWLTAMRAAMSLDAWRRNADALSTLALQARAACLDFAYHNHPIEFAHYGSKRGIDVILARTDPSLVKWELDVAWAAAGGADPIALLQAHGDRIRLLHVKGLHERPAPGKYGSDFATGVIGSDDVIDWRAVFAAARGKVEHVFVEQEPPHRMPVFLALERCRDALRAMA